ncbi:MAG: hypothetical protein ACRDZU_13970 [Acidimicrobiales bacterium]
MAVSSGLTHVAMSVPEGSLRPNTYIHLREQARSIDPEGYEHVDVLAPNDKGEGTFRFRHLLPMAVEVQYYAVLLRRAIGRADG